MKVVGEEGCVAGAAGVAAKQGEKNEVRYGRRARQWLEGRLEARLKLVEGTVKVEETTRGRKREIIKKEQ